MADDGNFHNLSLPNEPSGERSRLLNHLTKIISAHFTQTAIQFATVSLLVVFYAQVVHFNNWKRSGYRKTFGLLFIISNVSFFLIVMVFSVAFMDFVSDDIQNAMDHVYLAYMSCLDVLLAGMLTLYGTKLNRSKRQLNKQLLPRSPQTFRILNTSLVVLFIIRALYSTANALHLLPDRQARIDVNGDHKPMFIGIFMLYFISEIVPSLALVCLIWAVPARAARSFDSVGKNLLVNRTGKGRFGFLRASAKGGGRVI